MAFSDSSVVVEVVLAETAEAASDSGGVTFSFEPAIAVVFSVVVVAYDVGVVAVEAAVVAVFSTVLLTSVVLVSAVAAAVSGVFSI